MKNNNNINNNLKKNNSIKNIMISYKMCVVRCQRGQ